MIDKYLITKRTIITVVAMLAAALSGCVTQNYQNNDTPVVQNQANRNDMAATRISLGLGYLKMGNMPQAKQNLEKAKNFAPNMVQVYTAFAHYYETVGEHDLTIESYEKALSIKSDDADTLNNYGVYLCRQDKIEAAEKQFLKAISVPSYLLVAKSYDNLSSCFLQKDDFVKAEMYLNKAISHSPTSSSILNQMVKLQYAMGKYKQAKVFKQRFEKVTRRFTSQSLALAYKVHYKLRQRGIAKNYGAMLVKMYPQSWEAQQYLLNELDVIDADILAKRYLASKGKNDPNIPNKRVVKLSPNKPNKNVDETTIENIISIIEDKKSKDISYDSTSSIEQEQEQVSKSIPEVLNQVEEVSVESSGTIKLDDEIQELNITAVTDVQPVESSPINKEEQNLETTKISDEQQKVVDAKTEVIKEETPQAFPDFHVITKGDTLYSISVQYNIKLDALRRWNKLSENKKLQIKDIIFLENPKMVNQ